MPLVPLVVRASWDETPTLRGLRLDGPAELLLQYHTPGQYLELVHPVGSGYFALAAAPSGRPAGAVEGKRELEILVRRGPGLAGVLTSEQPDGGLTTPGVRGAGFALAEQQGRDLLLVAAGSGIAPLRAVLQVVREQRPHYGRVALYYGERDHIDIAYRQELKDLREREVTVELSLSRPPAAWRGGIGYVQSHLRALPPPWLGPHTAAFLCGQPAMVSEVTAMLTAHNVPQAQILLNY